MQGLDLPTLIGWDPDQLARIASIDDFKFTSQEAVNAVKTGDRLNDEGIGRRNDQRMESLNFIGLDAFKRFGLQLRPNDFLNVLVTPGSDLIDWIGLEDLAGKSLIGPDIKIGI